MKTEKNLSKAHVITWYGPFCKIEEVEEWERSQKMNFHLYLLQGKQRSAKKYSYYCGKTERSISARFRDKDHNIHRLKSNLHIWIGAFDNRFKIEDISIIENLLIYLLADGINEAQLMNKNNLDFISPNNICLFNKWHNPNSYKHPDNPIKSALPEVVVYDAVKDRVKVSKKLHAL
ncbi:hypothetical protein [Bacteroides heparinolyticus]|uniref:hypothetical protein n=1 Tax=Prevotella heparinolytica TaxID=28113 RepID=UPI0035A05F24